MKRTRRRRNRSVTPTVTAAKPPPLRFYRSPLSDIDHEALRASILAIGEESQVRFPELVAELLEHLKDRYPPHIIATLSCYGLPSMVSDDGVLDRRPVRNIQQHHIEILQALALTVPTERWGAPPAAPTDIQSVIDKTRDLTEAFWTKRLVALKRVHDRRERTALQLCERLRGHTQIVRNWGYLPTMVEISTQLYSPLDSELQRSYGFTACDLIAVAGALIRTLETRANQRWTLLRRILTAPDTRELVHRYCTLYPGIVLNPDDLLGAIPQDTDHDAVKSWVLGHADIDIPTLFAFDAANIARASGCAKEAVHSVLDKLSICPGALDRADIEKFFMSNPVWTAPGVNISGQFFFPVPQLLFAYIHRIMRSLADGAGLQRELQRRRAQFLEAKVREIVARVLPEAKLISNAPWSFGGRTFETDLVGQVDRTVLIIEAKSAALTPEGLRGASERVKRHVRELMVESADQSARLEQIIRDAKAGVRSCLDVASSLALDARTVDTVVRMSVTLDDFSMIASCERELRAAGWVPSATRLAPTLNVADLICVSDILDQPARFLHYLTERERIQREFGFLGDELDLLGLYLRTGFGISGADAPESSIVLSGLSEPIDRYYLSAHAGVAVPKPEPSTHPELGRILEAVQKRRVQGWTTVAVDLLRIGDLDEQTKLFDALASLRRKVARTHRDPDHTRSLVFAPHSPATSCILFYVYPEALREKRYENAEILSGNALAELDRERCVIVGRKIEAWDQPYGFIGIAYPPCPDEVTPDSP